MPSKLPVIKANTTQINIDKMKVIAENNKRSLAKELELIVENHIKEYEKKNGEIIIEKTEKEDNTLIKAVKLATGVTVGEKAADMLLDAVNKRKDSKD